MGGLREEDLIRLENKRINVVMGIESGYRPPVDEAARHNQDQPDEESDVFGYSQRVTVQRSDGTIEGDWIVAGTEVINGERFVTVMKDLPDGRAARKTIPEDELLALNSPDSAKIDQNAEQTEGDVDVFTAGQEVTIPGDSGVLETGWEVVTAFNKDGVDYVRVIRDHDDGTSTLKNVRLDVLLAYN